jgi:hypothetical protein
MFCGPFNGSISNALWVLLLPGIIVFLCCFFSLKKGCFYLFDPKHNADSRLKDAGDYASHSQRYQDLAKLAITLSGAAIAFLISVVSSDKPAAPAFTERVRDVAPIVCGFFGSSIALLVAFMVFQALWYEEYCHSPDHSSYKRWKYAVSMTLGFVGLLAFVLGFLWLAPNLFRS